MIRLSGASNWLLMLLLCGVSAVGQDASPPSKVDWLRGTGESLEIRLKGEIDSTDVKFSASLTDVQGTTSDLTATRAKSAFEVWVPVGKGNCSTILFHAESTDGKRFASRVIPRDEMRQAAIEGVKLTLRPFDRMVEILVVDKGLPVAGAQVRVDTSTRFEQPGLTNEAGIAKFGLFKEDTLLEITAWTKDHRIGGYQFYRQPTRDMKADKHTIELSRCRPQKIRFVNDADGAPVAGVGFTLWVATPTPFYNYVGLIPESTMKTDAKGEAIFEYFPDWPAHHFYADRIDKEWIQQGKTTGVLNSEGVFEVRLKKSQQANRKRITGRVSTFDGNSGGFRIELHSHQGEQQNRSERRQAFTDSQGQFSADVLPGATYCLYVCDKRHVSNMIDTILYDPLTGLAQSPQLAVDEGNPIEILVTSGPENSPVVAAHVGLSSSHNFAWLEKGELQHGGASRFWSAKTDERGIARTFAAPGKEVGVSFHQPDWDVDKRILVSDKLGEVTKVTLHREVTTRQQIVGKLSLPDDLVASLEGAKVLMSALDKKSRDQNIVTVDAAGKFTFDTSATKFGLFAYTADDKAAGSATFEVADAEPELTLMLKPTGEYQGRLVDENGAPLIFHTIDARIQINGGSANADPFLAKQRQEFTGKSFKVKTDIDGNFTIKGVPFGEPLQLQASATNDSRLKQPFSDIVLKSGEGRVRDETTLHVPLRDRFESSKNDATRGGFHLMVVAYHPTEASRDFIAEHLYDYDKLKEVGDYLHIFYQASGPESRKDDLEFAKSMNWSAPAEEKVIAFALDAAGKELGRLELAMNDVAAKEKAAKFVQDFAAKKMEARKKWEEAFALATMTKRKVWLHATEPFNPACTLLSRWLDQNKTLIEKDFVLVQVDVARDLGGDEILKRLAGEKTDGFPLQVIFEADGKPVIDSRSATGNIGFPQGADGVAHLKKMLSTSRTKLTNEEIEKLIKSLPE